jgi:sec-independent protein translocase protein TatA
MLSGIGPTGIILLVIVALLLFGPSKLPELGRAFGRTLSEFKKGAKDMMNNDEDDQPRNRREVNKHASLDSDPSSKSANTDQDNKRLPE